MLPVHVTPPPPQEFRREEEVARESSEKVLQRLAERMRKADQLSQVCVCVWVWGCGKRGW